MVLDGILEVASLEQQISHGHEAENVLGIEVNALLEVLGRDLELSLLEIQDTQLAEGLVVVCVLVDTLNVVIFRHLRVVRQEMQRLSVAENGGDAVRV